MKKHSWKSHQAGIMRCARRKCGVMRRTRPGTRTINQYRKPKLDWCDYLLACTGESTAN